MTICLYCGIKQNGSTNKFDTCRYGTSSPQQMRQG